MRTCAGTAAMQRAAAAAASCGSRSGRDAAEPLRARAASSAAACSSGGRSSGGLGCAAREGAAASATAAGASWAAAPAAPHASLLPAWRRLRITPVSQRALHAGARPLRARCAAVAAAAATAPTPAAADPAAARSGPSLKRQLEALFADAIARAFPEDAARLNVQPAVAICGNPKFGDYQCNNAMALFQAMKAARGAPAPGAGNPRAVAEAILAALPPSALVESTSIAGPGFINVTLSRPWLAARVADLLQTGAAAWAPPTPGGRRRAVVDFSSPNIAKEMHVGHLRSTIIGDTLARLLEYTGAEVLRLNHVGDWGTQFGMLIEHLMDQPGGAADASIADLQAFYKAAKLRFDADEAFKARAQAAVVRLQAGAPAERAAWERICAVSRAEFSEIYRRLDITLTERGESFYNGLIPERLEELRAKGVSSVDDGAECVFTPGAPAPLIVRKRDGGFNYASTDLAAVWQRVHVERADWIIYVTDIGQAGHFEQVFAAARLAGWLPPADAGAAAPVRVDHVGFGLVLGEDGKRFRTRSSEVVRLADLLDEAKARCAAALRERGAAAEGAELDAASEALGYGAVKYADLNRDLASNYKFSFDSMLDMKGNTAVYQLYAHTRIASIVRKAAEAGRPAPRALAAAAPPQLVAPEEAALALAVCRFPDAVESALEELAPLKLTDYLYDLSTRFTDFYGACQVLGTAEEASRLQLCEATAVIMRQTLSLLGIKPPMRL